VGAMTVEQLLLVMLGAAVGAPARYWTDRWVQRRFAPVMPWGTFIVNVVGSALLGVLTAALVAGDLGALPLALLGAGFCGGLTTFSSFGWETHQLAEDGALGLAGLNVGLSTVACITAAALGWVAALALLR
jgi:fluoride exporter